MLNYKITCRNDGKCMPLLKDVAEAIPLNGNIDFFRLWASPPTGLGPPGGHPTKLRNPEALPLLPCATHHQNEQCEGALNAIEFSNLTVVISFLILPTFT
jgi:hypothetical protein